MNAVEEKNGHIYEFGRFVLDPGERVLMAEGVDVHLTDKVFDTLLLLVRNNGRLLSKDEMMTSIWDESFVEESNLAKNISRLRKVLNGDGAPMIETLPKRGYRFVADVRTIDGEADLIVRRDLKVKVTRTVTDEAFPPKRLWLGLAAVPVIAVALAAGFYFLPNEKPIPSMIAGPVRLTDHPLHDTIPRWTNDGRIRFFRTDGKGVFDSWIMNADGTGQAVVNDFPAGGLWSPDGTKVVFTRHGDKPSHRLANSDGTNEITLPFSAGNTDWSADSRKIIYQSKPVEGDTDIFIYSLETGTSENITRHPAFDADPSLSPDGKQVVFASIRDGNAEIYLIDADGTDLRRLTNHAAWDNHPVFSPDGTTIAFNSDRENENSDVYFMNTDGSDVRRLTNSKYNESVEPGCWSPDGTKVAFYSDEFGNDDIFVTSAEVFRPVLVVADAASDIPFASYSPDGKQIVYSASMSDKTGELRLFDLQSKQSRSLLHAQNSELLPVFAPDGIHIAFQNKIDANTEICLINLDGTDLHNITNNPARDGGPAFAPDGKQIAFASNRDGNTGIFHLYLMDATGGNQHRIYWRPTGSRTLPAWWPDGASIVFTNDIEGSGNVEVFKLRLAADSVEERLTFRPRFDGQPSVSMDGKLIAFASNTDGNAEIYLMNSDGTNLRRLSRNPAEDINPKFSPDGSRILFSSNRDGRYAIYETDLAN